MNSLFFGQICQLCEFDRLSQIRKFCRSKIRRSSISQPIITAYLIQQCLKCRPECGRNQKLHPWVARDLWSFCPLWPYLQAKRSVDTGWESDRESSLRPLQRRIRARCTLQCQAHRQPKKKCDQNSVKWKRDMNKNFFCKKLVNAKVAKNLNTNLNFPPTNATEFKLPAILKFVT